jgi:hypothetical protein
MCGEIFHSLHTLSMRSGSKLHYRMWQYAAETRSGHLVKLKTDGLIKSLNAWCFASVRRPAMSRHNLEERDWNATESQSRSPAFAINGGEQHCSNYTQSFCKANRVTIRSEAGEPAHPQPQQKPTHTEACSDWYPHQQSQEGAPHTKRENIGSYCRRGVIK